MLRHCELYDPVRRTFDMDDSEFTKYVELCNRQEGDTPREIVGTIKSNFYNFATGKADDESINEIWDFVEPMLAKNIGLAQFTLDYHGDMSRYFFPWLKTITVSPAKALEMSYGAGYNLNGKWELFLTEDVSTGPDEDPICAFVRNDPTFVYNRERQLYIADLACTVYDSAWDLSEYDKKIIDLGAGTLAWARWHGYDEVCAESQWLHIYAFDVEKAIDPDEFLSDRNLSVSYRHTDIAEQLADPVCTDASLVILSGVVTYFPKDKIEDLIASLTYLLDDYDGTLFFDLQLDCPYLQRSMKLWGWPEMNLPKDAATAIAEIEAIRKNLWQRGYKFNAEYAVDTYNSTPSAVMITMSRV